MLCIRAAYAVVRCLSVRPSVWPSVTFVYCIKTSKHIFKLVSPSRSQTILVFRTKGYGNIPTGLPKWGKIDFRPISDFEIDDWFSVECR